MATKTAKKKQFGVYILKLSQPMGTAKHSAQYYTGFTRYLDARLNYHRSGRGSDFTIAAYQRGIQMDVELFIPCATEAEARELEKQIKARKNTAAWLKSYQRRASIQAQAVVCQTVAQ